MISNKKLIEDSITFLTPEEFINYYTDEQNKSKIDSTKTRSLNLMYKIKGHQIVRKNKEIKLKRLKNKNEFYLEEDIKNESDVSDNEIRMSNLERKVNAISNFLTINFPIKK